MRCKYCNTDIEQDAQFCPNCGKDLSKFNRCIKCGELLDNGTSFCPQCGVEQPHYDEDYSSKKWIIVAVLLLIIVIGGGVFFLLQQNSSSSTISNNTPTTTTSRETYQMSGSVSKYPVTMHFEVNGSQVSGYYYYDRQYEKRGMGAKLNLSGTNNDGWLDLNETNSEGTPTGHFEGWLKNGVFKGDFINTKGDRMPFIVTQ